MVEFWSNSLAAAHQFRPVPSARWNHETFYSTNFRDTHSTYTDRVAFLDEVEKFAALHHRIPPRRAKAMDPQHRLLVDLAREAVQDAGWERRPFDRATTGVFVGLSTADYKDLTGARLTASLLADGSLSSAADDPALLAAIAEAAKLAIDPPQSFSMAGSLLNMAPATVSELLDLGGPSFAIDAACSSALVALHEAVNHLRTGSCSAALVGGVFLNLTPNALVGFSRVGALSPAGVCRPFDTRADGFVLGEGGSLAVLRPLDDALEAGDRIYAVLNGIGTANDGKGAGPMTPKAEGQEAAMRAAYRDARVEPGSIDFLEAHGTGTTVGDRVEVEAIRRVRAKATDRPCYLSSGKAMIGHTLPAAGAAGVLRTALALHHRTVPPQPAAMDPHSELPLAEAGLSITTEPKSWPQPADDRRRAAVSSFGFGGTNVHAVLSEAPEPETDGDDADGTRPWVVLISADNGELLTSYAQRLSVLIAADPGLTPAAVARTMASRSLLTARLAVMCRSRAELAERLAVAARELAAGATGRLAAGLYASTAPLAPEQRSLAFLYPGQGSLRPGVLRDLVARFPALAEHVRPLADRVDERTGAPVTDLLCDTPNPGDEERVSATRICQPGLGVAGIGMTQLLAEMGVTPEVTLGHSVGEMAAAVAAGALTPDDGIEFLIDRGAAVTSGEEPPPGTMAAVRIDAAGFEQLRIGIDGVWAGCYNHPTQIVASGHRDAVGRLVERCRDRDVPVAPLRVSHAFHSPLMSEVDLRVGEFVAGLPVRKPIRTLVSSVDPAAPTDSETLRALWARQGSAPVLFRDAIDQAVRVGAKILVQVSAGDALLGMAAQTPAARGLDAIALMPAEPDDGYALLEGLGRLAVAGVPVNLTPLFEGLGVPLATLPPSPLATQHYSIRRTPGSASLSRFVSKKETAVRETPPTRREAQPATGIRNGAQTPVNDVISLLREQLAVLRDIGAEPGAEPAAGAVAEVVAAPPAPPALPAAKEAPEKAAPPKVPAQQPRKTEDKQVFTEVAAMVGKISAYPADTVRPDQTFGADLGFDSIMTAELIAAAKRRWPDLDLAPEQVFGIETVGELVQLLQQALGVSAPAPAATPAPEPVQDLVPRAGDVRRPEVADVTKLPEVVQFEARGNILERVGVANPYYIVHDSVINARTSVHGRQLISFSSYNYLGLSGHPMVNYAVKEAVERYGSSVSAARILSGNRALHDELDRSLASLVGAEDAISLLGGHSTNVGIIGHMVGPEDLIVHDALAHDSILQGCRLSGANRQPFPHQDLAALDALLTRIRDRYRRVLIIVEGVYSMDGDICDLPALIALKKKHGALLMVDEAHSIGVLGARGGGVGEHFGVDRKDVDIWMGTLSKSLASCGGYIAGRHELIEYLRYTLPGFIFSAGMSPANAAAALAALHIMREEPQRLKVLHDRAATFLRLAKQAGLDTGPSAGTPVVPCITGDSVKALKLADMLLKNGVSANPIMYPAVKERLARLRFFVTAEHTVEDIETTVDLLARHLDPARVPQPA
ncbi:type-I PKS [Actinoplanes sp. SE50]|uniref:type I polyketide synthase n=1 Tax=unclassified Actinoplanes TaxID=2626549 RepID=UPI00023ED6CB|nr:8-amino-7-oxononanoate synthase [Actinoplanes sp. SE50/110]ATO86313.1 type-I PKS [Actinoplanes sp. SE50]SLM03728.1 putative type-I polyketide synthase [Actinoplanes sp. SE50/110]